MILTNESILKEVGFPRGLDAFQVNPHSIDLRLEQGFKLMPGVLTMMKTHDVVKLPAGVMGVVDAGYEGQLILPMTNCSNVPIELKRGERVASIVFYRIEAPVKVRLSKYHKGGAEYVPDKNEEAAFLDEGRLDELKNAFGYGG